MGSAGWGMLLQLVGALAFWPVMLAGWRTGRSLGARLGIATALVLAFWSLSTGSYRMVTAAPARPEVILVGAPDGDGLAKATWTAGAGGAPGRIELAVWRRSDPRARGSAAVFTDDGLSELRLRWDGDLAAALYVRAHVMRLTEDGLVPSKGAEAVFLEARLPE